MLNILVHAASNIPFNDVYPKPKALTVDELQALDDSFLAAIERCKTIGCKCRPVLYFGQF